MGYPGTGSGGVAGEVLIAIGAVIFAIGAMLASALRQVFAVVLYRWATSGQAPQGFSEEDLRSAVRTRGAPAVLDRDGGRLLQLLLHVSPGHADPQRLRPLGRRPACLQPSLLYWRFS